MFGHQIIIFPQLDCQKRTQIEKNMLMMLEQIRLYVVNIHSTKEKSSMRSIINI